MFSNIKKVCIFGVSKTNNMIFNLTNIKTAKSRNGFSMIAKFHINGIFVADFEDKGDGSQPFLYINRNPTAMELFAEFDSKIEALPEMYVEQYDMNLKIDKYFFIDILHAAIINKTEFKLLAA